MKVIQLFVQICITLATLSTTTDLLAQSEHLCGTTGADQEGTYEFVQSLLQNPIPIERTDALVPVTFHIIGASNGAFAIEEDEVFDELIKVNERYAPMGIEFVHCGEVNIIRDNDYLTFVKYDSEVLCEENDVDGTINIYFAPAVVRNDEDETSLCGYAYNFSKQLRVFMKNSCATNGSTLAHELGHSLSLLHTHSTFFGEEFADSSNCEEAGDLLCDTPADPQLSSSIVTNSCEYSGDLVDPQGDFYNPDPRNIMSYSRKNCRIHFSEQQLTQALAYFHSNSELLFCNADSMPSEVNLSKQVQVKVYPNPADNFIQIEHPLNVTQVALLNTNGEVVIEIKNKRQNGKTRISTQNLPSGLYYLKLKSNTRTLSQKTIIFKN